VIKATVPKFATRRFVAGKMVREPGSGNTKDVDVLVHAKAANQLVAGDSYGKASKTRRRQESDIRNSEWRSKTPAQQLECLENIGVEATRQRKRIHKILAQKPVFVNKK
jgi:hypothetical protein